MIRTTIKEGGKRDPRTLAASSINVNRLIFARAAGAKQRNKGTRCNPVSLSGTPHRFFFRPRLFECADLWLIRTVRRAAPPFFWLTAENTVPEYHTMAARSRTGHFEQP